MTIWEVNTDPVDGDPNVSPFNCYKYSCDGNADDNVRTMCESILRSTVKYFFRKFNV